MALGMLGAVTHTTGLLLRDTHKGHTGGGRPSAGILRCGVKLLSEAGLRAKLVSLDL